MLTEHGIPAEKIVIGHMDLSCDINEILKVLKTGVTVGIDTIGKEMPEENQPLLKDGLSPDEFRADAVKAAIDAGYIDQLVLSLDICRKEQLNVCGGLWVPIPVSNIFTYVYKRGVTEQQVSQILTDNPNRILLPIAPISG